MQIQISWLLQKPTDLDLHCLLRQGMSCLAREGLRCPNIYSKCSNTYIIKTLSFAATKSKLCFHPSEKCLHYKERICSLWEQSLSFSEWSQCKLSQGFTALSTHLGHGQCSSQCKEKQTGTFISMEKYQ